MFLLKDGTWNSVHILKINLKINKILFFLPFDYFNHQKVVAFLSYHRKSEAVMSTQEDPYRKTQSEKDFMQKRFSDGNILESLSLTTFPNNGVSQNVAHHKLLTK